MPNRAALLLLLFVAMPLTGCTRAQLTAPVSGIGQSELAITSKSSPGVTLAGSFTDALYSFDGKHRATVLLYDGPIDNPTQAVTIRLFWKPRAGRTPIQSSATNATIHYIIFPGSEAVGIYAGAGFVFPTNKVGSSTLTASLWDASLSFADGTVTFEDLLGKAAMKGKFKARRNDAELDRAMRSINTAIRAKIGYPRLVMR